jgi:hypothetical protein
LKDSHDSRTVPLHDDSEDVLQKGLAPYSSNWLGFLFGRQ